MKLSHLTTANNIREEEEKTDPKSNYQGVHPNAPINKAVRDKGKTLTKAAKEIGVNKSTLSRWGSKEDGIQRTPRLDNAKKAAHAAGQSIEKLFGK